jgi:predicted kinase
MNEPFLAYVEEHIDPASVLIACGLPASYKTESTEVVAALKGHKILRTDLIRKEVLKNEDIFDEKVASNMDKRKLVYDEMFRQADLRAAAGGGVILDATFVLQSLRRRAAKVAADHGRTLIIQQTSCPRETSITRILARTKENYESNALTAQAYDNNVARFEPVDLRDLKTLHPDLKIIHLVIDTTSGDKSGADWRVIDRREV